MSDVQEYSHNWLHISMLFNALIYQYPFWNKKKIVNLFSTKQFNIHLPDNLTISLIISNNNEINSLNGPICSLLWQKDYGDGIPGLRY